MSIVDTTKDFLRQIYQDNNDALILPKTELNSVPADFNVKLRRDGETGLFYCEVGWITTKKFKTAREAVLAGNNLGQDVYGSTAVLIPTERFM
jgi:hypothetical protein